MFILQYARRLLQNLYTDAQWNLVQVSVSIKYTSPILKYAELVSLDFLVCPFLTDSWLGPFLVLLPHWLDKQST